MDAERIDERIKHDLGFSSILTEQARNLLNRLKRFLYYVLSFLNDSLPLDCRIRNIIEHGTKESLLLHEEEGHTDELILVVHPVLSRVGKVELVLELVRKRDEALNGKTSYEGEHALVDKALFHVSEKIQELGVAISYLEIAVHDYDAHWNRTKKDIDLTLGLFPHLGNAHLHLSHSIEVCYRHTTACGIAAATAVKLVGFRKLSKFNKRPLYIILTMLFMERILFSWLTASKDCIALLKQEIGKLIVPFEEILLLKSSLNIIA